MSRRTGSRPAGSHELTAAGYRVIALDNRGHGHSEKLYELGATAPRIWPRMRAACSIISASHGRTSSATRWARGSPRSWPLRHPERVRSLVFGGLGINMVRGMAGTGPIAHALEAAEHRRREESDGAHIPRLCRADQKRSQGAGRMHPLCARADHGGSAAPVACPVLVAVGERRCDRRFGRTARRADPGRQAFVIPGREHMKAVGDRAFKDGRPGFLAERQ